VISIDAEQKGWWTTRSPGGGTGSSTACPVASRWTGVSRSVTCDRVIVTLIPNIAGDTGLRVRAELDQGYHPSGTEVTN